MRRLALAFALLLTLFGAANAGAATAPGHLVVTRGAAHVDGANLKGWFVVANRGDVSASPTNVAVRVAVGEPPSRVLIHWTIRRAEVPALGPSQTFRVRFSKPIPPRFGTERSPIRACVGGGKEEEGCRQIGRLTVLNEWQRRHGSGAASPGAKAPGGRGSTGGTGAATPPSSPTPPAAPISTVPTDPIPYVVGEPFEVDNAATDYWAFVPETYDPSNRTATPLLVWLHGCGGYSEGDIWVVDPGEEVQPPQDWLTIAVGGREGGCWVPSADEAKVMAALADFETHFNVDRRRVILGGYSSGGDLAYRTGFRHSATFAGLLIENSSPFRDTESTKAESLAAATTKLHIVHLAHLQDTTYGIKGVREETEAVKAAGFPIERIEVPGEHWNDEGDIVAGHPVPGTDADLRELLLPHIDDGWLAPG
jgi:hypothetical protein